jgi:hypothetical protein
MHGDYAPAPQDPPDRAAEELGLNKEGETGELLLVQLPNLLPIPPGGCSGRGAGAEVKEEDGAGEILLVNNCICTCLGVEHLSLTQAAAGC